MEPSAVNDASYWREFEKNRVTHSAAHYLMAIEGLRREFGYARVTDVAGRLEVTRAAASMALNQLKKRALVAEDPRRFLLLTAEGERLVRHVERNFEILSRFFENVLHVPRATAQADACKMEHLVSLETGRRLVWLMRSILESPERTGAIRKAMDGFDGHSAPGGAEKKPPRASRTRQDGGPGGKSNHE